MVRYKELNNKIRNRYRELPRNQMKIADYFIENFDRVPFLTIHEVSAKTGASVATIVRFVQRVGFSGYSEFRGEIAEILQEEMRHKSIFPKIEKKVGADTLTHVANLEFGNINDTLKSLDRDAFQDSVAMLLQAEAVYTAGLGISFLLSEILAYQLTQVGIQATALRHDYAEFGEQLLLVKPGSVFLAFSFPPYSRATVEAAKLAKSRNISVIAITNKPASPISFYSRHVLVVRSENTLFTNSFAAISVLINAIATECAVKEPGRTKSFLKKLESVQDGLFID